MTIQQCRYAVEIANCGSFNEAAKRLFVTQSGVSNAIKELEAELQIIIFERTNHGISISLDGSEFLEYASQIIAQADMIEKRYNTSGNNKRRFSISMHHYDFTAKAFVQLLKDEKAPKYTFSIKEAKTIEVIEDVTNLRSDIGILYTSSFNDKVMSRIFAKNNLVFTPLFVTRPFVFISNDHPLASKSIIMDKDFLDYPYVIYEQGTDSSVQFAEEMLQYTESEKIIRIKDRGTLFDILMGTEAYTVGTGILISELNDGRIKSVPLDSDQIYTVGWISRKDTKISEVAERYLQLVKNLIPAEMVKKNKIYMCKRLGRPTI